MARRWVGSWRCLREPATIAGMSISRVDLLQAFDGLLQPERFKDYGPNGLQVEGKEQIARVVSGVTASKALIEAAIAARADAIFVHHGLFWRGQDGRVTGWMKQRLQLLLAHDINLLRTTCRWMRTPSGATTPSWARCWGGRAWRSLVNSCWAAWPMPTIPMRRPWRRPVAAVLGRPATLVTSADSTRPVTKVAWCTGGAQSYFEAAIAAGADVFITGEISEPQAHLARETGVAFIAAGHHATERYGAPAVAGEVARLLGIEHEFIEIDNPREWFAIESIAACA